MFYKKQNGFTLIELVVVIVLLGILGVTALGKFQDMSEEAHTAAAQGHLAQFSSAAMSAVFKYELEVDADPSTVTLQSGVSLPVNSQGWPGSPYDHAACLNLWQNLMTTNTPINTWLTVPLTTPAEGWEAFGSGAICAYLYKPDVTPFRYIIYFPANGTSISGRIYGIGM